jgi:Ca2+-binding RTX toxin-like protein
MADIPGDNTTTARLEINGFSGAFGVAASAIDFVGDTDRWLVGLSGGDYAIFAHSDTLPAVPIGLFDELDQLIAFGANGVLFATLPGFDDYFIETKIFPFEVLQTGNYEITVLENPGPVVVQGSSSADILTINDVDVSPGALTFSAGAGDDQITLGTGYRYVLGDGGKDTLVGNTLDNKLFGGFGDDVLSGGLGNDVLMGGEGNDNLTGDLPGGAAGADFLDGGAGADQMAGGEGSDIYKVDNIGDIVSEVNASDDIDEIRSSLIEFSLEGSQVLGAVEHLRLYDELVWEGGAAITGIGNSLENTIRGNQNDNILDGRAGADTMIGWRGNDTYFVDNIGDFVLEATSDAVTDIDTVYSSVDFSLGTQSIGKIEYLTLTGSGNISGIGDSIANVITGNDGDNVLNGLEGLDTLIGGLGNDTYDLGNGADLVIDVGGTADVVITTISRSMMEGGLQSIEHANLIGTGDIFGNTLGNALLGSESANVLDGYTGNDLLRGLGGSDTLIGGAGDDTLVGGAEADSLLGGAGNDTYVLEDGFDTISDEGGIDRISTTISRNLTGYSTVENLILDGSSALRAVGNRLANTITGNNAANVLDGYVGNDRLLGLGGNDVLIGGSGKDTSTGGRGNDIFRFANKAQSPAGTGADVVTDFDDYGNDRIDLRSVYGGTLSYVHHQAFTAAGQVRINDIPGSAVVVEVNIGGSLAPDMQIRLTGTTITSMTATDFYL